MAYSIKATGRLAGLVYLGLVLTGIFSLAYVPSQLITMSDATATYADIADSEILFRSGVAVGFVCYVFFLILPFVLYNVLASFGRTLAALMVGFAAVSVPISMIALSNQLAIVQLLGSGGIDAGDTDEMATRVMQYLETYNLEISVASIFWGLWLVPLGLLVLKSGVIPRVLGVFLVLGGAGYVLSFFGPVFFPGYDETIVADYDTTASSIGEIGTCLWLLIMGARDKPTV